VSPAPVTIPIKRVGDVRVELPEYMTDGAAGMDLRAALRAPIRLVPGARTLVPCGFAIAIPRGYEGQVRPRSGLALKQGLSIPNAPGTIDPDYRGEVGVILINLGSEDVDIEPGQRIAQLVICPVARAVLDEVRDLDGTRRGEGGFGHTT
jgi:dUTP pyrophosphatase